MISPAINLHLACFFCWRVSKMFFFCWRVSKMVESHVIFGHMSCLTSFCQTSIPRFFFGEEQQGFHGSPSSRRTQGFPAQTRPANLDFLVEQLFEGIGRARSDLRSCFEWFHCFEATFGTWNVDQCLRYDFGTIQEMIWGQTHWFEFFELVQGQHWKKTFGDQKPRSPASASFDSRKARRKLVAISGAGKTSQHQHVHRRCSLPSGKLTYLAIENGHRNSGFSQL